MENSDLDMKIEHLLRQVPEEGHETVIDLLNAGGESVKTIEIRRTRGKASWRLREAALSTL